MIMKNCVVVMIIKNGVVVMIMKKLCNCNNNEKIVVVLIKLLLHITCYMTVFIYGVSQYATGL